MLQTLFYIPGELFGLPVFGFGLLLAVWAVVSAVLLAVQVRRGGFDANTLSYAQVLAVLGLAIYLRPAGAVRPARAADPRLRHDDAPGRAVGHGAGRLPRPACGRRSRDDLRPGILDDHSRHPRRAGLLRAQFWHSDFWPVYERTQDLRALVFAVVNVAGGGLVVFGSLLGAMLGLGLFWWRHRIPLSGHRRSHRPQHVLGLALGRVGCMLNGCCYGGPCDLPWKVTFPWNSPVHQHEVVDEGSDDVAGLKFRDGPNDRPVIESVEPGSPAAGTRAAAGAELSEINGVPVLSATNARGAARGN